MPTTPAVATAVQDSEELRKTATMEAEELRKTETMEAEEELRMTATMEEEELGPAVCAAARRCSARAPPVALGPPSAARAARAL